MLVADSPRRLGIVILFAAAHWIAGFGLSSANDEEQIRGVAHQLAGSQLPSGLADFDFDFLAARGQGSGTSDAQKIAFIARQAHVAYVLAKYYLWSKDEMVVEPLCRFLDALGALSLPISRSTAQRWIEATHILSTPVLRYTLRSTLNALDLLYVPSG